MVKVLHNEVLKKQESEPLPVLADDGLLRDAELVPGDPSHDDLKFKKRPMKTKKLDWIGPNWTMGSRGACVRASIFAASAPRQAGNQVKVN